MTSRSRHGCVKRRQALAPSSEARINNAGFQSTIKFHVNRSTWVRTRKVFFEPRREMAQKLQALQSIKQGEKEGGRQRERERERERESDREQLSRLLLVYLM
ncbi:hypothetical protein EVAR_82351_1 [Eumeta japonica]|uniref:Uncharacterized protein n=1 Tax=Eumeta variegata TaxID=151549 RepID=A0A4C1UAT4_EUMVA|nr:hypothetical protein EVAR_82351_1 [Eumeta japonica]